MNHDVHDNRRVMKHGLEVGDLVKMKRGYSPLGLLIELRETNLGLWARIMWPDNDVSLLERASDVMAVV